MLLSMTGHGEAMVEDQAMQVQAEIRTVNNRFLKIHISADLDAKRQSLVENLIKKHLNRGSVSVRIKTQSLDSEGGYRLNAAQVRGYWLQLSEIAEGSQSINVESVLHLPGVVEDATMHDQDEKVWDVVEQALTQAIEKLTEMRRHEGQAMLADLKSNAEVVASELESIKKLAPTVVENYSQRMTERINGLLQKYDLSIQPGDVVREVGVFAERCDFSEETVRLDSHLKQFHEILAQPESNGRKLDFLVQEMLRETNTIGSKANDAVIAGHVVEIKTAIERIREMVQNVE